MAQAIFAPPNCTTIFCDHVPETGTRVRMGKVLDGIADHMANFPDERTFMLADGQREPSQDDVVEVLRETDADVMINYLPVGSQKATEFYAECALEARVALVNCIPVFIASDDAWAKRFEDAGVPVIGDDIKSQLGATIVHRVLTDLFRKRGVKLDRTYQLNTGGNTDFLNMLERARLASKKISKTEAVQSVAEHRLDPDQIHVGPSDYVAWQNDNKVCFLRMEGQLFGGVPMNIELRLSVEDLPEQRGRRHRPHPLRARRDGSGPRPARSTPRHRPSASTRRGSCRTIRHSISWNEISSSAGLSPTGPILRRLTGKAWLAEDRLCRHPRPSGGGRGGGLRVVHSVALFRVLQKPLEAWVVAQRVEIGIR